MVYSVALVLQRYPQTRQPPPSILTMMNDSSRMVKFVEKETIIHSENNKLSQRAPLFFGSLTRSCAIERESRVKLLLFSFERDCSATGRDSRRKEPNVRCRWMNNAFSARGSFEYTIFTETKYAPLHSETASQAGKAAVLPSGVCLLTFYLIKSKERNG